MGLLEGLNESVPIKASSCAQHQDFQSQQSLPCLLCASRLSSPFLTPAPPPQLELCLPSPCSPDSTLITRLCLFPHPPRSAPTWNHPHHNPLRLLTMLTLGPRSSTKGPGVCIANSLLVWLTGSPKFEKHRSGPSYHHGTRSAWPGAQ